MRWSAAGAVQPAKVKSKPIDVFRGGIFLKGMASSIYRQRGPIRLADDYPCVGGHRDAWSTAQSIPR